MNVNQLQMLKEVAALEQNIAHISEIVSIQQAYATMGGLIEDCEVEAIVEDALRLNQGAFQRHGIRVQRTFEPLPNIRFERGKMLQILHNLLRNAKHAIDEARITDKSIHIRIAAGPGGTVRIIVQDNGVGIAPENLTAVFQHGLTTRNGGHGFDPHSAANAAQSMRGTFTDHSDGLGQGAEFVLDLPASAAYRRPRRVHGQPVQAPRRAK
jgi:signal transduction histidine kinase